MGRPRAGHHRVCCVPRSSGLAQCCVQLAALCASLQVGLQRIVQIRSTTCRANPQYRSRADWIAAVEAHLAACDAVLAAAPIAPSQHHGRSVSTVGVATAVLLTDMASFLTAAARDCERDGTVFTHRALTRGARVFTDPTPVRITGPRHGIASRASGSTGTMR
jgi:hypothetical protein